MTTMDFLPSDLDQVPSNFLDMIENDINSQLLDLENFNSEKLNEFVLNNDLSQDDLPLDFDENSKDVTTWLQHFQSWNEVSKVPQSLIDASNENVLENKNPNLLVNPQSVLPVISSQQQNTPNVNQNLNVRNGVPINIKINGQDAILTPTQNPNIQYVTVQNVGTDSLNNTQIGYTVQPVTLCQQQVQQIQKSTTLSQNSPVLVEHLRNGYSGVHIINNNNKLVQPKKTEKCYPKPIYSYSCLIAMALKNSKTGNLPVSEIYTFMTENFPYFKTAPDGWKNSVRHNLSLNKCFAKVESAKPVGAHTRKGCLWALNPAKVLKMEEEIVKWRKKDPESVKHSMANPEKLELIESGKAGLPSCPKEPPVIDEPASPVLIQSEPPTPVKPEPPTPQLKTEPTTPLTKKPGNIIKYPGNVIRQPGNVLRQATNVVKPPSNVIRQSNPVICQPKLDIKREVGVMVKTEPDTEPMLVDLKDLAALGPEFKLDPASLTELGLQTGLWDDEMQTEQLQSPVKAHSVGTQYHGNITYTCAAAASPVQPNSPMYNTTPTKTYAQTPTKVVYPQTPTRIIIA